MKRHLRAPLIIAVVVLLAAPALPIPAHAQPASVRVDAAHEGWADAGIDLRAGEKVTLSPSGSAGWEAGVQSGPEGVPGVSCPLIVPSAPIGALVARIGAGDPVPVASTATLSGPGRLSLLYNDCPGQYFDNVGGFDVGVQVIVPAVSTPAAIPDVAPSPAVIATAAAPVAAPALPVTSSGRGRLPLAGLGAAALLLFAAAGYTARRVLARRPVYRFHPAARLESSAWLAPMRLEGLQGGRRPRRSLTIGGPDADIDFGLPGVWARLYPTEDGGARLETAPGSGRVLIDGVSVVIAQRLADGARVFMGTREFVYRADGEAGNTTAFGRYHRRDDVLSKPDPRVA